MPLVYHPILILLMSICLTSHANAIPREQQFSRDLWYPTYLVKRLNYCTLDGKECGRSLATRYCKLLGYERASQEIIDHNVGLTSYFLTHAQCKGWRCDGFKLITCAGDFSHKLEKDYYYRFKRFVFPRFDHYRVAWCYKNGHGCGQQVAYSYCRRLGYRRSQGYKKQIEVPATKALGDQELCFGKTCNGFREITCYR